MPTTESGERRLTTDRETIRQWAEGHGVVPVRTTESETTVDDSNPYRLRTETEHTETMETLSWDEFFQEVEGNSLVIVLDEESADRPLEVVDRDHAVSRTPLEASEVEERLLTRETVTDELTETTVVEHATIESKIVDTEELDSRVVNVALRSREISDCDVADPDVLDEVDRSRFEDMNQLTAGLEEDLSRPVAVDIDVEEDWVVTRELLERVTIESRITDVNVTETDDVEAETIENPIEIEGIQQALLGSDLVETEANAEEVIQSDTIESEFNKEDVVRTHFNQRRSSKTRSPNKELSAVSSPRVKFARPKPGGVRPSKPRLSIVRL